LQKFVELRQFKEVFVTLRPNRREVSSAGSEHLPYKQRVGGSNPSPPTKFVDNECKSGGIGRRTGFKIQRTQVRAGSTPASCTPLKTPKARLSEALCRAFSCKGGGERERRCYKPPNSIGLVTYFTMTTGEVETKFPETTRAR